MTLFDTLLEWTRINSDNLAWPAKFRDEVENGGKHLECNLQTSIQHGG